jgi:signal transduction histidine kinase
MNNQTVSQKLIRKIILTFIFLLVTVGAVYTLLTFYLTSKYFEEISQRLNGQVAQHLIDEKFQDTSPFLKDGSVNKPLFGDIMHDMMAVNRSIEVYLLNEGGTILYSVVLDHDQADKPATQISVLPILDFIDSKGEKYILGDDPRNPSNKKIFSAAAFELEGRKGYIYIILASQEFVAVTNSLAGSYFLKLGLGATVATLLFAAFIGAFSIWYLTKNLREIINTVRRFKEGDLSARISNAEKIDLSILAETYNGMADTIVSNIDELKSVGSLRRELVANVSHDLRTPLAIMQGYIETLQIKKNTITEAERSKFIDIIQKSIEKLSKMINQLFEYSKLEAKQITPQKEPFSIVDLTHDVYENYQALAKDKKIIVNLDVKEKLPLVFADISLVERVIQNLMDNALKFTPPDGTVTIGLNADKNDVFVTIKDTGIGISKKEITHIFERFTKADSNKSELGAGLGLAIAKKILEIHNSTLNVISQPNQGTTFTFGLSSYS